MATHNVANHHYDPPFVVTFWAFWVKGGDFGIAFPWFCVIELPESAASWKRVVRGRRDRRQFSLAMSSPPLVDG